MHFLSMLQEYMIPDSVKRLNSIGHVNTEIWIKYLNISIGIQDQFQIMCIGASLQGSL